jgi:hypothetical protein
MNREKAIAVGVALGAAYASALFLILPYKSHARDRQRHLGGDITQPKYKLGPLVLHRPGTPGAEQARKVMQAPSRREVARRTGVGDPVVLKRARQMITDLSAVFGVRKPIVTFGLTSRNASYRYNRRTGQADIRLREGTPWTEPLEYSILHEFAHHMVREQFQDPQQRPKPHGNEFLETLCRVLREYGKPFTGPVSEYKTVKACVLRSPAAPLMRESYKKPVYATDLRDVAVAHAVAELHKRTKGGLTLPSDQNKPVPTPTPDFRKKKMPRIVKLRRFEYWENGKIKKYPNWTLAYFLERKKIKDSWSGTWQSWYNVVLPDGTIHATHKHQIIGVAR